MKTFDPTARTTLKRLPARGVYDADEVYRILDEALVCHVGFVTDGQPFVIPTAFVRIDDRLYIHGSAASRMLRSVSTGIDVCVTVTLVDGLVLARSAFHHSINYRSVVVLGTASVVDEPAEKMEAMRALTEHIIPGRWNDVRWPTDQELKATMVLSLPISEVSAKVRRGPPKDDEEDYDLPVWAGELPLRLRFDAPIPDDRLKAEVEVPAYVNDYKRGE